MEEGLGCDGLQVRGEQDRAACTGSDSAWMRRHLSDSIYLWACGEKADDEDIDPRLTERFIGWLILLMQGFACTMLILLAGTKWNSDTDSSANESEQSGYLLPSVTGAMYLLVASTSHDLRAGFSLMVDGSCAGHRAFGTGLLLVYGIMITAAMTVLVSTSEDSTAVVLNAVTVLFVADLDEKALKFLVTVPHKWRLFWAIESIGISFALALIAIVYIGDNSPLLEGNNRVYKAFPSWYVWAINPVAVTVCSFLLSCALQRVCEWYSSEASKRVDESAFGFMVSTTISGLRAAMTKIRDCLRVEPCFGVALVVWLVQAAASWFFMTVGQGFPDAFRLLATSSANGERELVVGDNKLALIYSNAVLAIGLAAKTLGFVRRGQKHVAAVSESRYEPEGDGPGDNWGNSGESRVPALLIGWGVGYWVTSLLYVFARSWHGGEWDNAPVIVSAVGYVAVPCLFLAGIFMVSDTSLLGDRFGAVVKPAVERLQNRSTVEYWMMATAFRDILIIWIRYCSALRTALDYYS